MEAEIGKSWVQDSYIVAYIVRPCYKKPDTIKQPQKQNQIPLRGDVKWNQVCPLPIPSILRDFFCITNEFCLYMFSCLCPYIKYSLESKPAMGIWVKELCSWEARLSSSFLLFLLEHYLTYACWLPPVSKKQVNRCTRISAQSLAHSTWLVRAIIVFAFPFHVICLGN